MSRRWWQRNTAKHERVDELLEVDRAGRFLFGVDVDMALVVDREISFAPAGYIEEFTCVNRRPAIRRLQNEGAFAAIFFQRFRVLAFQTNAAFPA